MAIMACLAPMEPHVLAQAHQMVGHLPRIAYHHQLPAPAGLPWNPPSPHILCTSFRFPARERISRGLPSGRDAVGGSFHIYAPLTLYGANLDEWSLFILGCPSALNAPGLFESCGRQSHRREDGACSRWIGRGRHT